MLTDVSANDASTASIFRVKEKIHVNNKQKHLELKRLHQYQFIKATNQSPVCCFFFLLGLFFYLEDGVNMSR
jgi:hypothetical protein